MSEVLYKLPAPVLDAHGDVLRAWDWARSPVLALKDVLPGIEALANVRLEFAASGARQVVRPVGGGSAIRLRRYADSLAATMAGIDTNAQGDPGTGDNPSSHLRLVT